MYEPRSESLLPPDLGFRDIIGQVKIIAKRAESMTGLDNRARRRLFRRQLRQWLDDRIEPDSPLLEALSDIGIRLFSGLLLEAAFGEGGDGQFGFIAGDVPQRSAVEDPHEPVVDPDANTQDSDPEPAPSLVERVTAAVAPKKRRTKAKPKAAPPEEPTE